METICERKKGVSILAPIHREKKRNYEKRDISVFFKMENAD